MSRPAPTPTDEERRILDSEPHTPQEQALKDRMRLAFCVNAVEDLWARESLRLIQVRLNQLEGR